VSFGQCIRLSVRWMNVSREFTGHHTALELRDTFPVDVNLAVNVLCLEPREFPAPPVSGSSAHAPTPGPRGKRNEAAGILWSALRRVHTEVLFRRKPLRRPGLSRSRNGVALTRSMSSRR